MSIFRANIVTDIISFQRILLTSQNRFQRSRSHTEVRRALAKSDLNGRFFHTQVEVRSGLVDDVFDGILGHALDLVGSAAHDWSPEGLMAARWAAILLLLSLAFLRGQEK